MDTLTDKNYKQQIELMKTLNDGTQKQMQMTAESLERMQQNNEKSLSKCEKQLMKSLTKRLRKGLIPRLKPCQNSLKTFIKVLVK